MKERYSISIDSEVMDEIKTLAGQESRSLSSMIEIVLSEYCSESLSETYAKRLIDGFDEAGVVVKYSDGSEVSKYTLYASILSAFEETPYSTSYVLTDAKKAFEGRSEVSSEVV